jgi:hypothetical protein
MFIGLALWQKFRRKTVLKENRKTVYFVGNTTAGLQNQAPPPV